MEQKVTPPWTKALIISLISIVISLAIYFSGQLMNRSLSWITTAVFFVGIIWACINFAKQMDANVTFGNVFAHGFKVVAGCVAITAIYSVIAIKFIHPEIIDLSIEEARKNMEAQNQLSDSDISNALDMTRRFFIPFALAAAILGGAVVGAIAALIGAAVAKKQPRTPFEQQ